MKKSTHQPTGREVDRWRVVRGSGRDGDQVRLDEKVRTARPVVEAVDRQHIGADHEFADRGGVVVTVSYDLMIPGATRETVRPKLEAFTAERKMDVPVLVYDAEDHDAINDRFGIPGEIPVTLAIDKSGKIVDRQFGAADKDRFEEMMRRVLP